MLPKVWLIFEEIGQFSPEVFMDPADQMPAKMTWHVAVWTKHGAQKDVAVCIQT